MTKFVIDEGHNRHEGYSKEETDAAIDAAVSNLSNLADAYDDTATYAVGDLCIHDNQLYKCTTAITTAEAWNASHWTATNISSEMISKNKVHSLKGTTNITSSTTLQYTGVRIDIPANSIYTLMATAVYLTNTPSRCLITTSATSSGTLPNADSSTGSHKTTVVSGYAANAVSFFVWAQYSGAGSNRIDTDGFYIKLS